MNEQQVNLEKTSGRVKVDGLAEALGVDQDTLNDILKAAGDATGLELTASKVKTNDSSSDSVPESVQMLVSGLEKRIRNKIIAALQQAIEQAELNMEVRIDDDTESTRAVDREHNPRLDNKELYDKLGEILEADNVDLVVEMRNLNEQLVRGISYSSGSDGKNFQLKSTDRMQLLTYGKMDANDVEASKKNLIAAYDRQVVKMAGLVIAQLEQIAADRGITLPPNYQAQVVAGLMELRQDFTEGEPLADNFTAVDGVDTELIKMFSGIDELREAADDLDIQSQRLGEKFDAGEQISVDTFKRMRDRFEKSAVALDLPDLPSGKTYQVGGAHIEADQLNRVEVLLSTKAESAAEQVADMLVSTIDDDGGFDTQEKFIETIHILETQVNIDFSAGSLFDQKVVEQLSQLYGKRIMGFTERDLTSPEYIERYKERFVEMGDPRAIDIKLSTLRGFIDGLGEDTSAHAFLKRYHDNLVKSYEDAIDSYAESVTEPTQQQLVKIDRLRDVIDEVDNQYLMGRVKQSDLTEGIRSDNRVEKGMRDYAKAKEQALEAWHRAFMREHRRRGPRGSRGNQSRLQELRKELDQHNQEYTDKVDEYRDQFERISTHMKKLRAAEKQIDRTEKALQRNARIRNFAGAARVRMKNFAETHAVGSATTAWGAAMGMIGGPLGVVVGTGVGAAGAAYLNARQHRNGEVRDANDVRLESTRAQAESVNSEVDKEILDLELQRSQLDSSRAAAIGLVEHYRSMEQSIEAKLRQGGFSLERDPVAYYEEKMKYLDAIWVKFERDYSQSQPTADVQDQVASISSGYSDYVASLPDARSQRAEKLSQTRSQRRRGRRSMWTGVKSFLGAQMGLVRQAAATI